jgi:hypothetical protein
LKFFCQLGILNLGLKREQRTLAGGSPFWRPRKAFPSKQCMLSSFHFFSEYNIINDLKILVIPF